ncbi:FtsX-like permease family protein [Brachybacterium muris]|nr:FtsX-like permease family protein [Brachybacterium muris]
MGRLALGGAWAHRGSLAGSALALAVAAALLAVSGVLIQTGLSGGTATGMLTALAGSFGGTVMMATLMVVASTVALALRGRQEDFALLRAVGATRRQVRTLVAIEIMALALLATPVGALAGVAASVLLDPLLITAGLLPTGSGVVLGAAPVLGALLVLLPVTALAAMVATRETLRSSPTQAVRRRGIESGPVGRARIITGIVVGTAGLASTLSPLFFPGTLGAASAGISAFLLIGVAALLGPLLFSGVLGGLPAPAGPATQQVALSNLRGFSRRLTSAVVPLALVLAAGAVQTSLDRTVLEAARIQVAEGLDGNVVLPAQVDPIPLRTLPGVAEVSSLRSVAAEVLTDEDLAQFDSLAWTPTRIGVFADQFDPGVVDGSLDSLEGAGTIAVSQDAALETGGVGSRVTVRFGAMETTTTVVAVYERGLGFGDHLTGQGTIDALDLSPVDEAVLLRTDSSHEASVATATGARTPAQYATDAVEGDGTAGLSAVLLLALLSFVVIAAANTLLMITARRREEFRMLHRIGATGGTLVRMSALEALLTGIAAWMIGTVAALPALLGSNLGLLGLRAPAIDLVTYGALSVLVLVLPLVTMVPVAWSLARLARPRRILAPPTEVF